MPKRGERERDEMPTATQERRGRGRPKINDGEINIGFPKEHLDLLEEASKARGVSIAHLVREAVARESGRLRHDTALLKLRAEQREHRQACNGASQCVCTCPNCTDHVMAVG